MPKITVENIPVGPLGPFCTPSGWDGKSQTDLLPDVENVSKEHCARECSQREGCSIFYYKDKACPHFLNNVHGALSSSSCKNNKNYYQVVQGMTTLKTGNLGDDPPGGIMDFTADSLDACRNKCLQSGHCSAHQVDVLDNGTFRCQAWFDNVKSDDKEKQKIVPNPAAFQVYDSEFSSVRPLLASLSGPVSILFRNDLGPTQVRPMSCQSPLDMADFYQKSNSPVSRQECEFECRLYSKKCKSYTYSSENGGTCTTYDSECTVLRGKDVAPKSLGPDDNKKTKKLSDVKIETRDIFVSKPGNNSLSCRKQMNRQQMNDYDLLEKTDYNFDAKFIGTCQKHKNCFVGSTTDCFPPGLEDNFCKLSRGESAENCKRKTWTYGLSSVAPCHFEGPDEKLQFMLKKKTDGGKSLAQCIQDCQGNNDCKSLLSRSNGECSLYTTDCTGEAVIREDGTVKTVHDNNS